MQQQPKWITSLHLQTSFSINSWELISEWVQQITSFKKASCLPVKVFYVGALHASLPTHCVQSHGCEGMLALAHTAQYTYCIQTHKHICGQFVYWYMQVCNEVSSFTYKSKSYDFEWTLGHIHIVLLWRLFFLLRNVSGRELLVDLRQNLTKRL